MKSLGDFPYLSSRDFKLSNRLTDEQLQDLCTQIRGRINNLVSSTPKVSVVFPAYNEEMYLPLMLWTLSKLLTTIPIEIIGVNNTSTDRTGEIIEQSGVIRIDELRKGVSYARQAGLEAACGDIVATTDADTQVPETWIDTGLGYFNNDPNLVCFGGGSVVPGIHPTQRIIRVLPRVIRFLLGRGYFPHDTASFAGANTFFKREAAQDIGGYALGFDLGEDNLIAQKMKSQGRIMGITNSNNVVLTSNRRANSFRKVIQMYLANFKHVNPMENKSFIVKKPDTFLDIR